MTKAHSRLRFAGDIRPTVAKPNYSRRFLETHILILCQADETSENANRQKRFSTAGYQRSIAKRQRRHSIAAQFIKWHRIPLSDTSYFIISDPMEAQHYSNQSAEAPSGPAEAEEATPRDRGATRWTRRSVGDTNNTAPWDTASLAETRVLYQGSRQRF